MSLTLCESRRNLGTGTGGGSYAGSLYSGSIGLVPRGCEIMRSTFVRAPSMSSILSANCGCDTSLGTSCRGCALGSSGPAAGRDTAWCLDDGREPSMPLVVSEPPFTAHGSSARRGSSPPNRRRLRQIKGWGGGHVRKRVASQKKQAPVLVTRHELVFSANFVADASSSN